MPAWSIASLPYFLYIAALAAILPGLPTRSRMHSGAFSAAGLALAILAGFTDAFWLRGFLVPPIVLLIAYHASGQLWQGPMFGVEAKLIETDCAIGVPQLVRRVPVSLAEVLELGYFAVYPFLGAALFLHLAYSPAADPDRFWTVILVTDYACFALFPFIQTRPPRALEPAHPWTSRFRTVNIYVMRRASIQMNTLPSGHAAEALAAALLLLDAPAGIVASMFLTAAAISAGAVLGRYHYAIDMVTGWATALVVWAVLGVRS